MYKTKIIRDESSTKYISELNSILQQFMGGNEVHPLDPDIIFPILENIMHVFRDVVKILQCFTKSFADENDPILKTSMDEIEYFTNELSKFCDENALSPIDKKKNLSMIDISNNTVYEEKDRVKITLLYNLYKNCEYTNALLEYLNRIHSHSKLFSDLLWVNSIPGDYYEIFPFSSLNIKYLVNIIGETNDLTSVFLYKLLRKLYDKAKKLYELIITPTIDISNLSDLLLQNMPAFRKEVNRCDKAFDKIESSLAILKNNFPNYYKDYAITNDFGIVIQNYISDIYEDSKNDPILVSQLKKIISHFSSKIKNHKNSNSSINNLVDKLNNILN